MKLFKVIFLLIVLFTCFSCLSTNNSIDLDAPLELDPEIESFADVTVEVTPLTEQDLKNRYGSMAIYFYKHYGMLPRRNIHILHIKIETEETKIRVNHEITSMSDGEHATNPLTRDNILDVVGNFIGESELVNFIKLVYRDFNAQEIRFAKPGDPAEFYLYFLNRIERDQPVQLLIPARTSEGDSGIIEMDIFIPPFSSDLVEVEDLNEGIFLEHN